MGRQLYQEVFSDEVEERNGQYWYETWGENRIFGKIEATLNMRNKYFCG